MGNLVLMVLFVFIPVLIKGMVAPCVMDVKIGAKTYGPMATPAKIAQEDAKYLGTKKPLGKKLRFYYILVYCCLNFLGQVQLTLKGSSNRTLIRFENLS